MLVVLVDRARRPILCDAIHESLTVIVPDAGTGSTCCYTTYADLYHCLMLYDFEYCSVICLGVCEVWWVKVPLISSMEDSTQGVLELFQEYFVFRKWGISVRFPNAKWNHNKYPKKWNDSLHIIKYLTLNRTFDTSDANVTCHWNMVIDRIRILLIQILNPLGQPIQP